MNAPSSSPARVVLLAAVDESKMAEDVISTAATLARSLPGAELHLVHVITAIEAAPAPLRIPGFLTRAMEGARELLDRYSALASAEFSGRIVTHAAGGDPWREVLQVAADLHADWLIVGTHGYSGLKRLVLGSVAEQIVRKAACSVLVARPKLYDARDVPELEPACPDCLAMQRETGGKRLWCSHHEMRHGAMHVQA